jgi:hypothetical protein
MHQARVKRAENKARSHTYLDLCDPNFAEQKPTSDWARSHHHRRLCCPEQARRTKIATADRSDGSLSMSCVDQTHASLRIRTYRPRTLRDIVHIHLLSDENKHEHTHYRRENLQHRTRPTTLLLVHQSVVSPTSDSPDRQAQRHTDTQRHTDRQRHRHIETHTDGQLPTLSRTFFRNRSQNWPISPLNSRHLTARWLVPMNKPRQQQQQEGE